MGGFGGGGNQADPFSSLNFGSNASAQGPSNQAAAFGTFGGQTNLGGQP